MKEFLNQLKDKGCTKETIASYMYVFRFFEGKVISRKSIREYEEHILSLAQTSRAGQLRKLKQFLKVRYPDLAHVVNIPKAPKALPKKIPDQDEVSEVLQLPDICSFQGIRDRAILELFYASGIRKSELIHLKLEDIDFSKQFIRINQGKMKKDRLIPVSKQSLKWISRYVKRVRKFFNPKTNYVFLSKTGHRMDTGTPYKIIRKYSEYGCHKYRHAFATHLLQNGMKEVSLQRLLGHSHISTTQIYTKVTINELKASYKKYHQRDKWN